MRLVAAGAWHNLVFWGVLLFFAWACQGWSGGWGYVGYEDMSGEGRVVLGFDEVSWAGVLFFGMLFIDAFIACCYRTRSYATTSP